MVLISEGNQMGTTLSRAHCGLSPRHTEKGKRDTFLLRTSGELSQQRCEQVEDKTMGMNNGEGGSIEEEDSKWVCEEQRACSGKKWKLVQLKAQSVEGRCSGLSIFISHLLLGYKGAICKAVLVSKAQSEWVLV